MAILQAGPVRYITRTHPSSLRGPTLHRFHFPGKIKNSVRIGVFFFLRCAGFLIKQRYIFVTFGWRIVNSTTFRLPPPELKAQKRDGLLLYVDMSKAHSGRRVKGAEKDVDKTKRKGEQKKQLSPSPLALKRSLLQKKIKKRPLLLLRCKNYSPNETHPGKSSRNLARALYFCDDFDHFVSLGSCWFPFEFMDSFL